MVSSLHPFSNWVLTTTRREAEESTANGQKAALQRKEIFKKWFLDSVLSVEAFNELTTITVAPISDEEPKYRDDYKQYEVHYEVIVLG